MALKAFQVVTFATTLVVVLSVMSSVWAEEEENFLPVEERSEEEDEATLEELLADILERLRVNEEKRGLGKFGRRPLRQCKGNSMCKIFYGSRPKTICSCPKDTECMAPPNSRFKYRCM
ncbi:uncharacterized protein LOC144908603 [Branchiostoma floridae x Branchiostoma belcheri]|nr:hypothetical protein Bbelb_189760 [Branchiostoma belcheri]